MLKNVEIIKKLKITRYMIEDEKDFDIMLKHIKNKSIKISIDTENGNLEGFERSALNPTYAIAAGISLSVDGRIGFYIPINHIDYKDVVPMERIKEIFNNKKLIIMHNCVYDASIFITKYNYDLRKKYKFFDTMIAQHLIDEYNPKGLKVITKRYFGIEQGKFEWDDACKARAVDIYKYACDDAIYTYLHYLRIKESIKKEKLVKVMMEIEMPFQRALIHMKLNGIYFDVGKAKELEKRLEVDKKNLIDEIISVTPEVPYTKDLLGGKVLNIKLRSPKDLIQLLFDRLNLIPIKKTKEGKPCTDKEALKALKNDFGEWQHPIVPLLIKYSEVTKLLNTYTSSLYNKVINNRIYTDFKDHGTTSGRLSSANPNFQNLPKNDKYQIRSFLRATPGYKMFVSDFSQEELRVAGVLTDCPTFKKAYNKEQDLHLKVANECYNLGIPEDYIVRTNPKYKEYEDKFHKERFNAKSINFGIMYGRSAHGLAPQLKCSIEEAQNIINDYFKTFPEVKTAIEMTRREISVNGFIRNMYGRKRRFTKIEKKGRRFYPPSALREAFNTKIQGSCSDILRIVMVAVLDYIEQQPKDEVRMISTVHDEIIFEIKDNENYDMHTEKINRIMETTVKLDIPLLVDSNSGANYAEAK